LSFKSPPCVILTTLNAKYIHASLGLRYLLANMAHHGSESLRAQTVLREFTIARPPQEVTDALLTELGAPTQATQMVGFGVYVWNVSATTEVVRLLKLARPDVRVILGGPEVSHEWETQEIVKLADHLITGWGDVSFPKLCRDLLDGRPPRMKVLAGEQPPLDQLVMPYTEYSVADLAHRLLYVEASRGCPFKCEFCLSALDQTAWAFPLDRFLTELERLYVRGARNFKFVDRTFNLKIDSAIRILQFFLEHLDADLFLHFELVPDHLPDALKEMIARFPPGVLQFEVGIQTFDSQVQQRISRRQDNAQTEANLRWLVDHSHAHVHADLIFALPGETLAGFAVGFDRLHALRPHEIQLGILKRLRGAPVARHTARYGMQYNAQPPYAVQQTGAVDALTVQRFVRLARYWELVANSGRFKQTLPHLLANSPFEAFQGFADWLWQSTGKTSGLSPERLVDALFDYLTGVAVLPPESIRQSLLADYLASGARANPACLQGLLQSRVAPQPKRAALAVRQARHAKNEAAEGCR